MRFLNEFLFAVIIALVVLLLRREPAPPTPLAGVIPPGRYQLSATPWEAFKGAPGGMMIIEARNTVNNRLSVVLVSTGSANPPRMGAGGEGLSQSMCVLSTSTEGNVK